MVDIRPQIGCKRPMLGTVLFHIYRPVPGNHLRFDNPQAFGADAFGMIEDFVPDLLFI